MTDALNHNKTPVSTSISDMASLRFYYNYAVLQMLTANWNPILCYILCALRDELVRAVAFKADIYHTCEFQKRSVANLFHRLAL